MPWGCLVLTVATSALNALQMNASDFSRIAPTTVIANSSPRKKMRAKIIRAIRRPECFFSAVQGTAFF